MSTQFLILAAGKGKRMQRTDLPKVLIPLQGRPMISYVLDEIQVLSKHPAVIVVGYMSQLVQTQLGLGYVYALQEQQLGTAHAVWSAQECISADHVVVLYGDTPFVKRQSLEQLIDLHDQNKATLTMFTTSVPHFEDVYAAYLNFGRIIRTQENQITKIVEYKDATLAERAVCEVNPGIYVFKTNWLWNSIPQLKNTNAQGEYYLTDLIALAMQQDQILQTLPINPLEVYGINTTEQLHFAENNL